MESSTLMHNIINEVRGWEDVLVTNILALQTWGNEFRSQNTCDKSHGVAVHTYNLSITGMDTGRSLGSHSGLFSEFQANDRPYLKSQ